MVLYKHCFLYLFWSKFDFRKLPTVLVVSFLTGLTFLSQKSTYSRNSNHRWKIREQKENFQTILAKMFWNFSVFQYRFYSPQVKQTLISTLTNLVCELSRKRHKTFLALPNFTGSLQIAPVNPPETVGIPETCENCIPLA